MASSCPYYAMFTYDSSRDLGVTRTALGTACSWSDLCIEFDRQGPSCPARDVIHFKTISKVGPKLFAVSSDTLKVYYHDEDQWHQYQSARNVRLGTFEEFMKFFYDDDDNNNNEDWSQQDNNGKDRDDDEPGRQAKDSHSNNNSTYQINQAILYYHLCRMLLFIQLEFYFMQCQSFIH